jgi:hypothetical protein
MQDVVLNIMLAVAGFLATTSVGVLCWFLADIKVTLKEISHEMTSLNLKIVEVVGRQEWAFNSIQDIQERLNRLENKN